jgi:hypothetical protein
MTPASADSPFVGAEGDSKGSSVGSLAPQFHRKWCGDQVGKSGKYIIVDSEATTKN